MSRVRSENPCQSRTSRRNHSLAGHKSLRPQTFLPQHPWAPSAQQESGGRGPAHTSPPGSLGGADSQGRRPTAVTAPSLYLDSAGGFPDRRTRTRQQTYGKSLSPFLVLSVLWPPGVPRPPGAPRGASASPGILPRAVASHRWCPRRFDPSRLLLQLLTKP